VVAGGQVQALNAVVALNTDLDGIASVAGLQLPLATETQKHDGKQYAVYFAHGYVDEFNYLFMLIFGAKLLKYILKSKF
jgi:hypothetical protein